MHHWAVPLATPLPWPYASLSLCYVCLNHGQYLRPSKHNAARQSDPVRRPAPATEKPPGPKLGFQRPRKRGPLRSIYDGDLIPRALPGLGRLALHKSSSGSPTTTACQSYQARCRVARKKGLPGLLSPTTASQGHHRENIVDHGRG